MSFASVAGSSIGTTLVFTGNDITNASISASAGVFPLNTDIIPKGTYIYEASVNLGTNQRRTTDFKVFVYQTNPDFGLNKVSIPALIMSDTSIQITGVIKLDGNQALYLKIMGDGGTATSYAVYSPRISLTRLL